MVAARQVAVDRARKFRATACEEVWSFSDLLRRHECVLPQLLRVDLRMRMPGAVGRRRRRVQHPCDTWETLPVVQPRVCWIRGHHDADLRAAARRIHVYARVVDVADG